MNISELLASGANVTLSVSPGDLHEFGLFMMSEAAKLAASQSQQPEQYLTADETAMRLNVSRNSLWRWAKSGYLVPVKTGRTIRYRLSDVQNLFLK